MTRKNRNVAIIGGGHNSLVSAAYLAKAGFNVELFEARSEVGGMASTKELIDGYKVPGVAHLLHQTDGKIHKSLQLNKHGLTFAASGLKTISINPNGNALIFDDDTVSGDDITMKEQEQYKEFRQTMKKLSGFFKKSYQAAPPRLGSEETKDMTSLMSLGWNLRSMGKDSMRQMLKYIAVNIHDV
ncbi:MAG TPA: NAD(P)-binding protein, partial [Gammaproteobacteria bacterium]|nr:NAD(P)-binding protein [Gammaproteobacteria bacterium]